jgi:hypothetical protein
MATAAPGATRSGFDFGRSFTFVSEDPDWIKKLLIGGAFALACVLLVGIPFVMGYFARTLRNAATEARPTLPEWDDLGGIFEEGLRLTAVYLVYLLVPLVVLGVLAVVALVPMFAASGAGRAGDALGALSAFGILGLYALLMLFSLALAIYLPAALVRTTFRGSVGAGLEWRENLEFIRANLGNYALALVSYLLASFLSQFGVLLCCVGLFPAAFWSYLVLAVALGQTVRLAAS